jgi:hypothetical protein
MNDDSARLIKLEDGEPLQAWKDISDYWTEQPAKGILSVILRRPAGSECAWLVVSTVTLTDSSCR